MADAVAVTGMEYGGITPIGLPAGWPILIDAAVAAAGPVVIGSGIRGSKIVIDGAALGRLPGAEVIEGLATPVGNELLAASERTGQASANGGQDLRADQRDVVEIGQVEHLQIGALHAGRSPSCRWRR